MKSNNTTKRIRYQRELERIRKNKLEEIKSIPELSDGMDHYIVQELYDLIDDYAIYLSRVSLLNTSCSIIASPLMFGVMGYLGGLIVGAVTGYKSFENHPYLASFVGGVIGSVAGGLIGGSIPITRWKIVSAIDNYKTKIHNKKKRQEN